MTWFLLAALPLLASLLSACGSSTAPIEPVWHKQPCDHCHMLLSDPRYAAQLTTDDGQRFHFDDVGCLAAFMQEKKLAGMHAWVRDGNAFRDANSVRFATGAKTPMDYGFVASPQGTLDFAGVMRAVAAKGTSAHVHGASP